MSGAGDGKRAQGLATLEKLFGPAGKQAAEAFDGIAPDMGRYIVENVYGDILMRPALDLKTRQLATIAALTALGYAKPHLKTHIDGALNVGASPAEIVEIIFQMSAYAGFPAATTAMMAARDVFEKRGVSPGGAKAASP